MRRFIIMCLFIGVYAFLLPAEKCLCQDPDTGGSPLASHFSKRYTHDLEKLLERKYIRVLTCFNRTNFFISGGKFYGFEYALLKEYEEFLNKGVKRQDLRVVIEFIPVARDRLVSGLTQGYGDIAAAGLTVTPERARKADFTDPYLTGISEVVVAHRDAPVVKKPDDLSGRDVFVRKSSSYYDSLLRLNKKLKNTGKPPVDIIPADENLETEDILELVNTGAIKTTISDSHIASIWSNLFKNIQVLHDVKVRTGSRIAWMVRKNNPELKSSLNRFLESHRKGTLMGNIYFNRYYKSTKWLKDPLGPVGGKRLRQYMPIFKKYSSRYDFDWMLIMAMAYQESGLDQNKKSHVGAVGVMQVMPKTAGDKNVGIKDIYSVEGNVHAGVKYLDFLRDRYFNSDTIRPRDRVRLAMASYNAGPGNILRARSLAEKMGLDPNRWFRNVEMATLKIVGQEPVRYVSNINKYYLMYKLGMKNMKTRREEKKDVRK